MIKFNEKYDPEIFSSFLQDFLPEDYVEKEKDLVDLDRCKIINKVKELGYCESLNVHTLEMSHSKETDPRVTIATDAFRILATYGIDKALVIFKNDESENYRFSYLTVSLDVNKKNKVVRKYSNARRYSFYLGVGAKIKTPEQQLTKKEKVKDIEDLLSRFSVEVVNKQFYLEVAKYFDELVSDEAQNLSLPFQTDTNVKKSFAVRLIGRIMFCWFLKQKKSDKGQLVPDEILSSKAVENNYYHSVLEPLFFEILNTNIDERDIKNEFYDKVPYLNGGLFSPQSEDYYELDREVFASKFINTLKIDDKWFKNFFELLETYNFTIDENTVFDQELSVDPEMLGRIFENLLAEINPETGSSERKRTGSFYTPRQIVEYMVDQSLTEYFKIKTSIDDKKLKALLSYDEEDDLEQPLTKTDKQKIVNAIESLKILDPACGSGAFPIGVLQKIVYVLQVADPDGSLWRDKKLKDIPELYRKKIEEEFDSQALDYIRKLEVIKNSIFGVDIQPIAVEVSRLRCFLTLVVESEIDDTKKNRGIQALPNLDFKFVSANTLISLPKMKTNNLFDDHSGIVELSEIMSEYFSCNNQRKSEMRVKFIDTQKEILNKTLSSFGKNTGDLTLKLTLWNPFDNESNSWFDPEWMFGLEETFDIVIGNPPYVQLQKNGGELANLYKDLNYETFARTGDIYALFYERGLKLSSKKTGLLCYITSNKWMRAGYGEKLRHFFAKNNPLQILDFGGFKVFESATVDTNILLIQNIDNKNKLEASHFRNDYKKGQSITEYFEKNKVVLSDINSDTWFIGSKTELNLKKKIEEKGIPLKDCGIKINYGIKTGFNDAFIIDKTQKVELIKNDERASKIILPLVRGKDIGRYYTNLESNTFIILISDRNNINDFPSIKEHLKKYEVFLKKRAQYIRGDHDWFTVDNCPSKKVIASFSDEKILWGNISYKNSFSYSGFGEVLTAPGNILLSTEGNIKYLLGCMNSKIFNWEFSQSGIDLGKAFEWKKQYVEKIHIPKVISKNKSAVQQIELFVNQILVRKKEDPKVDTSDLENQIDALVMDLYELTSEEKEIIRKS